MEVSANVCKIVGIFTCSHVERDRERDREREKERERLVEYMWH